MFYTIEELVSQAEQFSGSVSELMIATEMELTGRNRDEILTIMSRNLTVMKIPLLMASPKVNLFRD